MAGDVKAKAVRELAEKYWGAWKRGEYPTEIPAEPIQDAPRSGNVEWPAPTLPLLAIAYKIPGYTDTAKDTAALQALSLLAFSPTSELYQKLIIRERKADQLSGGTQLRADPFLFEIRARIQAPADVDYVREQILETVASLRARPVDAGRLAAVKKHLQYSLSAEMDTSDAVADVVARFVGLRRSPETIERLYAQLAQLTPEDIQQIAAKYLTDNGRTIITLRAAEGSQ